MNLYFQPAEVITQLLFFKCETFWETVNTCLDDETHILCIQCFLKVNLESTKQFTLILTSVGSDTMSFINGTQPKPLPRSCTCKYGSPSVTSASQTTPRSLAWHEIDCPQLFFFFACNDFVNLLVPNKSCLYTY